MFGIIADLISSVTTILLPVYASYKALRTSDPAQLTPWLIYWVVLSLLLLVESWTVFIIGWFPFYSWLRLIFLSYLVLPQTQGAKLLYYTYIEPFIVSHEHDIDIFIGETHKKLSAAGLGYLNTLIDLFVEQVLGRPPACKDETHEPPPSTAGYAQALFSRFAIPSARPNIPAPADFYGMLSGAVAAATSATATFPGSSRSRDLPAETPSHRTGLYPESMSPATASPAEKADYINAQREKLGGLMKALDREQQNLDLAYGDTPNLTERKNKSTHSFETVEHADAENGSHHGASQHHSAKPAANRRTTSGNWIPSGWWPSASAGEGKAAGSPGWSAAQEITEAVQGISSSVDPRR